MYIFYTNYYQIVENLLMDDENQKDKQNEERAKQKRSQSPRRVRQMTKEQFLETLKKKKECNAKAQKIVEEFLEPNIEGHEFLSKIQDINQSHYQDIVEERAIIKICGYPLCKEPLNDIPKKQYHISTRTNKVYDITERKYFCSNNCYKASQYIKEQILTSPLWLRDQEIIPEFKLLNLNDT